MTAVVRVKQTMEDGKALVMVDGSGEASDGCAGCRSCAKGRGKAVEAVAENRANAKSGDLVTVYGADKKLIGIAALVYILPIVLFFIGYFLPVQAEGAKIALAFLGLLAGLGICVIINNIIKKRGRTVLEIIDIVEEEQGCVNPEM